MPSLGSKPGLGASTSVLFMYYFPLILGTMGRGLEGFGVDIHFRNVVPGSYLAKSIDWVHFDPYKNVYSLSKTHLKLHEHS